MTPELRYILLTDDSVIYWTQDTFIIQNVIQSVFFEYNSVKTWYKILFVYKIYLFIHLFIYLIFFVITI